jgi:hypothetical protein
MTVKKSRAWRVVLVVFVLLVAFRLILPYIVTRYVTKILSELEGYRGSVSDVDIHLYRGAYQIDSIRIFKIDGEKEIPFVDIPLTDLSIEWRAILDGELVGEITFKKPVLNFIAAKKSGEPFAGDEESGDEQSGKNVDWTEPVKKLMPFRINRLRVSDGKVAFYDFSTAPKVDLFLNNVELDALNLNNAKDNPELLPSRIYLQALSIGNGQLNIAIKANVLKEVPDLDMDLRFENVNLKALNDFFGAYAKIDVEHGTFNMYSEVAVLDGKISGYAKPIFHELRVVDWKDDKDEPVKMLWESMVNFIAEGLEDQKQRQFATKVPLTGEITSVDPSFLPALWNIFSNAFVEAFDHNTEGTVSIASASTASSEPAISEAEKTDVQSKRELRKERKKARQERRRARKEKKEKSEDAESDAEKSEKDNS